MSEKLERIKFKTEATDRKTAEAIVNFAAKKLHGHKPMQGMYVEWINAEITKLLEANVNQGKE